MDYYPTDHRSRSQSHSDLYAQWDALKQTPLGEDAPDVVDVDEQERCRLCLEPPTEPCCLTRCGHVYCSTCIYQWLDFSPKCYTCKTSATSSNVMPLAPKRKAARGFGFADYFPVLGSDTSIAARDGPTLSPFSSSSSYCESSPGTSSSTASSSLPSISSARYHISLPPTRPQSQRSAFPALLSPPDTAMSSPSSSGPSELGLSFAAASRPREVLLPPPKIVFYKDDEEAAAASSSSSTQRVVIRPERGGSHVYDHRIDNGGGADDEHYDDNEDDQAWNTDEELDHQLNQLAVWQERSSSNEFSSKKQQRDSSWMSKTGGATNPEEEKLYPVQSRVLSVVGLALMLAVILK
ncbi:peroxisome biogenesis factor 10 [Tulasnella sp. 331]|nr:peroxisome biogenesis factor 10 [Tulasnella sp. 331]KAG8881266.1 peroxisome biogenesis factor 10 [Tulasnella sp. 332]